MSFEANPIIYNFTVICMDDVAGANSSMSLGILIISFFSIRVVFYLFCS